MNKLLRIGICTLPRHQVSLRGIFLGDDGKTYQGECYIEHPLRLTPTHPDCLFVLHEATIGIGFHWQQQESQGFRGVLNLVAQPQGLTAVNEVDIETYLESVISSEMRGASLPELLKAHAVISRSWALAQLSADQKQAPTPPPPATHTEIIRWYDRDGHTHAPFDLCADDHCQRYYGVNRIENAEVHQSVQATRGEVLCYAGQICDARFHKCCGGACEAYENIWDSHPKPYLTRVLDASWRQPLDLRDEAQAQPFIRHSPPAWCNTQNPAVLTQILNDFDCIPDFYRWQVQYTQAQLSAMVRRRSGIDFGTITDLIPRKRGVSARIIALEIVGDKRSITVGKELEIRKWLSDSHLYSSCFVVDRNQAGDFILRGAGWGHGAGLCQIGAACMALQGHDYRHILQHYYPGSELKKISIF